MTSQIAWSISGAWRSSGTLKRSSISKFCSLNARRVEGSEVERKTGLELGRKKRGKNASEEFVSRLLRLPSMVLTSTTSSKRVVPQYQSMVYCSRLAPYHSRCPCFELSGPAQETACILAPEAQVHSATGSSLRIPNKEDGHKLELHHPCQASTH